MVETAAASRPVEPDTAPARGRREMWAILAIVGSTLPLFALHLNHLWKKPHYQFFPLLLLGIGGLVWQRRGAESGERGAESGAGRWWSVSVLGMAFLLLGLGLLAAGVLLFSAWLVAVAALLTSGGLLLRLAEPQRRREWLPLWALLWLLLPMPLDWDRQVITQLQTAVSRAGSLTLDLCGVGHLLEGNVVVLPGHRLLVEEACSGINSLFTLLALTALFAVAIRRPLMRSGLLLASAVVWAGLMNTARVVTVAVVQARYDWDLSSGWPHAVLGLTTVGVGLLLVVCTDRLLTFLLGPIVPLGPGHELNPMSKAWNWCLGWRDVEVLEWARDEGFGAEQEQGRCSPDRSPRSTGVRGEREEDRPSAPTPRSTAAPREWPVPRWIVAGFVVLGVVQLGGLTAVVRGLWAGDQRLQRPELFRRSDLPATLGDWTQVDFTTEENQWDWGDFRQVWTYRSPHGEAAVAVAYPFRGWHDLRRCYKGRGWKIKASEEHPAETAAETTDPYLATRMRGLDDERGLLLFSLVDQAGGAVEVPRRLTPKGLAGRLLRNPLWSFLSPGRLAGEEATFQVQTLVASLEGLSAAQQAAVHRLFVAARQTLVSTYLQQEARDD